MIIDLRRHVLAVALALACGCGEREEGEKFSRRTVAVKDVPAAVMEASAIGLVLAVGVGLGGAVVVVLYPPLAFDPGGGYPYHT
jgi:hypothetical protein